MTKALRLWPPAVTLASVSLLGGHSRYIIHEAQSVVVLGEGSDVAVKLSLKEKEVRGPFIVCQLLAEGALKGLSWMTVFRRGG